MNQPKFYSNKFFDILFDNFDTDSPVFEEIQIKGRIACEKEFSRKECENGTEPFLEFTVEALTDKITEPGFIDGFDNDLSKLYEEVKVDVEEKFFRDLRKAELKRQILQLILADDSE